MQIIQICNSSVPERYKALMLRTKAVADAAGVMYRIEQAADAETPQEIAAAVELQKLEILSITPDAFIVDADDELLYVPEFPKRGMPYFDYIHGSDPASPIHPSGGTIYCNGCCAVFKPLISIMKQNMYFGAMRRKCLWDVAGYEIDPASHKHYFLTRKRGRNEQAAKKSHKKGTRKKTGR